MKILRWITRPWRWMCARIVEVGQKQLQREHAIWLRDNLDAEMARAKDTEADGVVEIDGGLGRRFWLSMYESNARRQIDRLERGDL
jgi:hypothetical protein